MPVVEGGGVPNYKPVITPAVPFPKSPTPIKTAPAAPAPAPRGSTPGTYGQPTAAPAPRTTVPRLPAETAMGTSTQASGVPGSIQSILDLGNSFLGVPYKWGGTTPNGFDCSGLLQYIYAKNGIQIPRVSRDQARAGRAVSIADAQPGDLIAFDNTTARPGVDHIGIYLGGGKMLQAPRAGKNVEVVNVNLARATTIRRIVDDRAFAGMAQQGGKYVYTANATPGATSPTNITAAQGGGDPGTDPSRFLGADGQVDPSKAIEEYGFIAELANSNPEIKAVFQQAISAGWDAGRFTAAIRETGWYKQTSDNQRQVQILQTTNPGEYARQLKVVNDEITVMMRNLGVPQDNERIGRLAAAALANGWSGAELNRYVAAEVKVNPLGGNTGQIAVTVDQLKEQAAQYAVPLSDATVQEWTQQILRGMVPAESFESYLKEQAKSLFPGLAAAIDSGITVAQYTDPYRQIAAQTLELNPNDIDINHKHVQRALYSQGKDGSRTPMNLSDYQRYLRDTDEYRGTRQAQETAATFTNTITDIFGATA